MGASHVEPLPVPQLRSTNRCLLRSYLNQTVRSLRLISSSVVEAKARVLRFLTSLSHFRYSASLRTLQQNGRVTSRNMAQDARSVRPHDLTGSEYANIEVMNPVASSFASAAPRSFRKSVPPMKSSSSVTTRTSRSAVSRKVTGARESSTNTSAA